MAKRDVPGKCFWRRSGAILMIGTALSATASAGQISYLDQPFSIKTLLKSQWDPADPVGILADPCEAAQFQNQAEKLIRDFGEICRFEQENKSLPSPTSKRVVFFGDSITANWGHDDKILFQGDRIDRGIGGQTTAQMLLRFKADALDLKPRVIHLIAGTNDIAGNTGPTSLKRIEDNITSMIELARGRRIKVIVGSIFPVSSYNWNPSVKAAPSILPLNRWLEDYCKSQNIIYVDYYRVLAGRDGGMNPKYSDDGVHPNALAYELIRPLALEALKKAERE